MTLSCERRNETWDSIKSVKFIVQQTIIIPIRTVFHRDSFEKKCNGVVYQTGFMLRWPLRLFISDRDDLEKQPFY
jgi:hypothetical protein